MNGSYASPVNECDRGSTEGSDHVGENADFSGGRGMNDDRGDTAPVRMNDPPRLWSADGVELELPYTMVRATRCALCVLCPLCALCVLCPLCAMCAVLLICHELCHCTLDMP